MLPHHKFGIPTSKNIGDMHRQEAGLTDGQTDRWKNGVADSAIAICLPKFLTGHKNGFVKKRVELMIAANPVCMYIINRRPMVGVLVILASK